MPNHLNSELIEIDQNELRALLQARGFTRYDLAKKLNMSTKTVQRWLNATVRRIRMDTLEKLALALDVKPEQLKKHTTSISTRATNRAIEELCSQHFIRKVHTSEDWENFLAILKTFCPNSLSSEQRLKLFKHIGISSLHLRKYRACKLYLNEAASIAKALDLPIENLDILNWLAIREQCVGNFVEAALYFQIAEELLIQVKCSKVHAFYYHKKARLLHHTESYQESIVCNKKSLALEYQHNDKPNMLSVSCKYFLLGTTYMHIKNYSKARVMFLRNIRAAEKAGWVQGCGLGHFYLGIISKLSGQNPQLIRSHFGKARTLNHFTSEKKNDPRLEKVEFLNLIFNGRFEEAKQNLNLRLKKNRNSRLHFSYAILDCLFLQKLQPGLLAVRESHVEVAEEFFSKNKMKHSAQLLETMKKRRTITEQELLDCYPF
ncbi:helix-turn-helix domain-containing protein [Bdellovibrio svalbardensis]|uniref:Helix-turn-helix transcriptional regulator n=1 Tax=Bdellovibrio svalbardensis TaxID=2972972 RepID=A0ABT6DL20_9BACT|nr:helix-turn-helix transcriptional regulator [Bdellovibrio svalbardensis]MDG0817571.1 helix-turn-helix transcriptional regulator [Bdellovibrio svalbardensis]